MRIGAALKRLAGLERKVHHAGADEILCHHYRIKSLEDYAARAARLNDFGFLNGRYYTKDIEEIASETNEVERSDILKFAEPLRAALDAPVPPSPFAPPYYSAVLTMFRAEENHIDEWIAYHLLQGIEHFFLYNNEINGGDLGAYRKLHDYVAAGWVTLIDWPDSMLEVLPPERRQKNTRERGTVSIQALAIREFCARRKHLTRWIASIDVDEFILPLKAPDLKTQLRAWERYKGIVMPRLNFGSSGHVERPAGLTIENYTRSEEQPSNFKPIGQTRFIGRHQTGSPHSFRYR